MTHTLTTTEELNGLANHIASTKGGLPQDWQDWADEIEADIRNLANREAQPVYQCRFFTTDVDGKQIGEWQDMDKGFYDQYDPYCRRILYTALPVPAALDGWQIVPVEPTCSMCSAGREAIRSVEYQSDIAPTVYKAMLAAVPEGGNDE